ncbi:MAG: HisA/HisF-related TIM barrel protein [Planctomycetota bacterium]
MDTRLDRLIGVVDLKQGSAVRAIQGERDRYRPVETFHSLDGTQESVAGNPSLLARAYHRSSLSSLYIADLDGLCGRPRQLDLVGELLGKFRWTEPPLVDLGLTGRESADELAQIATMAKQSPIKVVLATESADSTEIIERVQREITEASLSVCFDYRNGHWISESTSENDWISACLDSSIDSIIALDVGSVGTASPDRAESLCTRLHPHLPSIPLITGGGIRTSADLERVLAAGADRVLVASMFVR